MRTETPASFEEAAAVMRGLAADGLTVRPTGGGTKLEWGAADEPDVYVSTRALNGLVEHNPGDFTAVVQAGMPLAEAQAAFAAAGQMLALDPPLGTEGQATVGGVVATADGGPLRHRYGAPRDLLLGITVALSDGTVANSGGKVIKNVAGYDLAKLFAGSFGSLGLILQVVVRLHPLPRATATAVGESPSAAAVARAALALAHTPLELEALDVSWERGGGALLARLGGRTAEVQAKKVAAAMAEHGLEARVVEDDAEVWERQRARQRTSDGLIVRVSGLPSELAGVLRAADGAGASAVGRAGAGLSWLRLPASEPDTLAAAVVELRRELAPASCVVLDAPPGVKERVDVWGFVEEPLLALMRRVKERFDPGGILAPGSVAGGI